jgi:Ca2+-transporting ATPase
MTVQQIFAGGQVYEVTGTGYDASGVVQADGKPVVPEAHPALLACLRAGLLCNDSVLIRDDGKIRVEGDPTEAALIVAAEKAGLAHADVRRELTRSHDSIRIRAHLATSTGKGWPRIYSGAG